MLQSLFGATRWVLGFYYYWAGMAYGLATGFTYSALKVPCVILDGLLQAVFGEWWLDSPELSPIGGSDQGGGDEGVGAGWRGGTTGAALQRRSGGRGGTCVQSSTSSTNK